MNKRQKSAFASICLIAGLLALPPTYAQPGQMPSQESGPIDPALGISTVKLWEETPPFAQGEEDDDIPTLTVFAPHRGHGNGAAVVIAPGGAYLGLASNLEGRQLADWFASRGFTAFVLKYRKGQQYLFPVPLIDAQRAIRWVRAHHEEYNIAEDRIGMAGFSAGGHLTAMTATSADYMGAADAPDNTDRLSSKPDFIVLGYPWLNAMQQDEEGFIQSYPSLMKIPEEQWEELERNYTPLYHVSEETPPAFIWSTTDDEVVPVHASVDFYNELIRAGVPVEMHIFRHGAHGSGLGRSDPSLEMWPDLLSEWLRGMGLYSVDP